MVMMEMSEDEKVVRLEQGGEANIKEISLLTCGIGGRKDGFREVSKEIAETGRVARFHSDLD